MDPLSNPLIRWTQEMLPWISTLVNLGGVLVVAQYLGRSRWIVLVFASFLVGATLGIGSKLALPLLLHTTDPSSISTIFTLFSAVGVIAQAGLVVGLAGTLSDWARAARTSPSPLP